MSQSTSDNLFTNFINKLKTKYPSIRDAVICRRLKRHTDEHLYSIFHIILKINGVYQLWKIDCLPENGFRNINIETMVGIPVEINFRQYETSVIEICDEYKLNCTEEHIYDFGDVCDFENVKFDQELYKTDQWKKALLARADITLDNKKRRFSEISNNVAGKYHEYLSDIFTIDQIKELSTKGRDLEYANLWHFANTVLKLSRVELANMIVDFCEIQSIPYFF